MKWVIVKQLPLAAALFDNLENLIENYKIDQYCWSGSSTQRNWGTSSLYLEDGLKVVNLYRLLNLVVAISQAPKGALCCLKSLQSRSLNNGEPADMLNAYLTYLT